jgi:hypothetical protein
MAALGTVGESDPLSGAASGSSLAGAGSSTETNPVTPTGNVIRTGGGPTNVAPGGPGSNSNPTDATIGGNQTPGNASTDPGITVPPLGSLAPTATPVSTYNPTSNTQIGTATASDVGPLSQAQTASQAQIAQLQPGQGDSTNAADQLNAITSENSPYMQLAKQQGLLTAAGRGLENSSLAAGSSEAAATAAAAPLAEQNASGATQSALQQQQLGTQTSEFNVSQQAAAQELAAQLGTSVSQTNAQMTTSNNEFNAQQTQAAAAANAAATNTMAAQTAALTEDMNKQDLSGTQAARLAQIQASSNQLIASNQSASSMYASFLNSMSATMANQNISPQRAAETMGAMQSMLEGGLNVIDQLDGVNLDITLPTVNQNLGPTVTGPQGITTGHG